MIKSAATPVGPPRVSSSPGRAAPAAPRLSRLLRGKSGARSRGARSSPMFLAKSGSVARSSSAATAGDEPSSPKVTCIGQVRIRGNSKKKKKSGDDRPAAKPRCRCIQRALLCFGRTPPASGRPHRRTPWGLGLWPSNYQQQKVFEKGEEAEVKAYTTPVAVAAAAARGSISSTTSDLENGDRDAEEETRVFITSATPSPPKNALLLMRCRSAPHNRSSVLATSRFAVSLSPPPPEAAAAAAEEEPDAVALVISYPLPKHDEDKSEAAAVALPVVLTRSKSEPASTAAEKMVVSDDAAGFWNSSRSRRPLALVREEAAPR